MRAVFKNNELEKHLAENGFCVIPLLKPDDVAELEKIYYANRVEEQTAIERSTNTTNHEISRNINQLAGNIIYNRVNQYLLNYRLLFSGFITKIPGKPSRMRLHQDPTFVDESQFKAINVWCPLIDVEEKNGAVGLVPNSDKFFAGYRGQPARKFDFAQISEPVIKKFGKIMPMKAGEALVYDTTLFHFSTENTSGKIRIANSTILIPEEAMAIYYHHNRTLNTLDVCEMGEDFMLRYHSEYLKTGVVNGKVLSRTPYQLPQNVSFAEFEEKYNLYNTAITL